MADKETPEQESAAKGGKKKLIMIIAIAAIILIGGGVGAYLFLSGGDPQVSAEEQAKAEKEAAAKNVGPMIDIASFIVNILDDDGTRYLKTAITLEVDDQATAEEINLRMPQLKDAILLLISNKTFAELRDLQGKLQLRAELTTRINSLLKSGQVKQIYFTDFVVQ